MIPKINAAMQNKTYANKQSNPPAFKGKAIVWTSEMDIMEFLGIHSSIVRNLENLGVEIKNHKCDTGDKIIKARKNSEKIKDYKCSFECEDNKKANQALYDAVYPVTKGNSKLRWEFWPKATKAKSN